MDTLNLLIVEDNPTDALLLTESIQNGRDHLEVNFDCVERLQDATRLLSEKSYDAVLLDLGLPDSEGIATFLTLHHQFPRTPILVLTGLDDKAVGLEAVEQGAQDYLIKNQIQTRQLLRSLVYSVVRQKDSLDAHDSESNLRMLTNRLLSIREEERKRISREIHDILGQQLTGIKMDIQAIERKLNNGVTDGDLELARTRLDRARELSDHTIDLVRRIATELRPSVLDNLGDNLGLISAIRDELRRFESNTSIIVNCLIPETLENMDSERATAMFRIFQELLTNIIRHSDAENVDIHLCEQNEAHELVVRDDGIGFEPSSLATQTSLGILGMKERAESFSGQITYESAPSKGTCFTVRIPYPVNV